MRVLPWSERFGTDARIWWSSTSMGRQDTSKACLYVCTTQNLISGASITPTPAAELWANLRSANLRMDAASFTIRNPSMGESFSFEMYGQTSLLLRVVLNKRSRWMVERHGRSTGSPPTHG